ncbi:hypothetical protein EYF80_043873 [Liparis tanakae]|uniref:Uncharacterized protein n=1 Tax=Liparis tanakae TaxID=230148 RepID=A0A4Z2FZE5_9TELE|nr:hypothetical protein EYF80_043873 [Liparis tanakae]
MVSEYKQQHSVNNNNNNHVPMKLSYPQFEPLNMKLQLNYLNVETLNCRRSTSDLSARSDEDESDEDEGNYVNVHDGNRTHGPHFGLTSVSNAEPGESFSEKESEWRGESSGSWKDASPRLEGSVSCTLWVSDVEVLRRPLLGAVLGVGARPLLGGHVVQHDGRQAVTPRVMRPGETAGNDHEYHRYYKYCQDHEYHRYYKYCQDHEYHRYYKYCQDHEYHRYYEDRGKAPYLRELADGGEAVGQRLVPREAVALHAVGGLGGAVARRQAGRRRVLQTSRVEHGLRLRARRAGLRATGGSRGALGRARTTRGANGYLVVSRTGSRVLGRRLVPSGGAGGLRVVQRPRVVGEGLG